jgi:hypothetical protein
LDVELQVPDDDADYAIRVPAYGLYYVCEDIDGACQYLRQDVPIEIRISGRQTR